MCKYRQQPQYTITATAAANDTYKETTATCTLKVINSAVEETSIEFVAGVDNGTGKDSDHAQNDDEMHKSFVKITSDNAWFDSTQKDNYRFYTMHKYMNKELNLCAVIMHSKLRYKTGKKKTTLK